MKIRILTIVQSVFIAIIFLLAWPFAVAIYGAEEESVKNNICAVYLGVEDYGWISTENKDNFIHHFFVDGQQKSYKMLLFRGNVIKLNRTCQKFHKWIFRIIRKFLGTVWIRLKKSRLFNIMKSWWSQEFHQINTCYIFVQKGGGYR